MFNDATKENQEMILQNQTQFQDELRTLLNTQLANQENILRNQRFQLQNQADILSGQVDIRAQLDRIEMMLDGDDIDEEDEEEAIAEAMLGDAVDTSSLTSNPNLPDLPGDGSDDGQQGGGDVVAIADGQGDVIVIGADDPTGASDFEE